LQIHRGYLSDSAIKRFETTETRNTRISIESFDFIKMISKGAFGRVWLVKKRATGDLYAMKIIDSSHKMDMN